jgi:cyanate permease
MAINQLAIIGAPPLLGLVHDLTGGYAALWSAIVGALAVSYALTFSRRTAGG